MYDSSPRTESLPDIACYNGDVTALIGVWFNNIIRLFVIIIIIIINALQYNRIGNVDAYNGWWRDQSTYSQHKLDMD